MKNENDMSLAAPPSGGSAVRKEGPFFEVYPSPAGDEFYRVGRPDHRGEFDELWASGSSIHIERMDTRAFWIGITLPDGRRIHVNTGVHRGTWFFNVEEDWEGGEFRPVRHPACHRLHPQQDQR